MHSADYFRYTFIGFIIRTFSGGRILPHVKPVSKRDPAIIETQLPEEKSKESDENKEDTENDEWLVEWDGPDDPANPKNFSVFPQIVIGVQIGLLTFMITHSSSIYTGGITGVIEDFHCSSAVASLGVSLFVFGYGLGPLVWGPLSEIPRIGRNWIYLPTLAVFIALQVPTALAGNLGTLLSMRFLAGLVGSPVLAVGAGSMVDVFPQQYLAVCLGIWGSMAAFGPLIGLLVGGFAFQNLGHWRWTIWPIAWEAGFILALTILLLPETSAEKLLSDKAARLRAETGNPRWRSKAEKAGGITIREAITVYLYRPFALLILEPIVLLLSLYLALLYGLEYCFFEAFPYVYAGLFHWKPGPTGASLLGVFVGVYIGLGFQLWFIAKRYVPLYMKLQRPPQLEIWLWPMLFACWCVPISMFWFGWSARPSVHWIVPIIGSVPFGFALFIFFQGVSTYLAFGYQKYAASVFAANDFLRCAFAGAFPIFSNAMYKNLGPGWASSIPAFISIILIPVPFAFYKWGPKIRGWSKYAEH